MASKASYRFHICCQIFRYPVTYRSALGSQTRCRMMLFLLPYHQLRPFASGTAATREVAPGPVSSCCIPCREQRALLGQRWKCSICAWEKLEQMPFGIPYFSFTTVLRIAYKRSTFKLPLPSNFPF